MKNRKVFFNSISGVIAQIVTIIYGLVIPRLIILNFGSSVNGLVSSISQFLLFFQLFEGGISGVILASLYKPVAEKDVKKIGIIRNTSKNFLNKLGLLFLIYTIALAIFYPFIKRDYDWLFTFTLVIILSFNSFIQFFFVIFEQLLIRADNRYYIVNVVTIITTLLNILLAFVCIKWFPSIHIIKLMSSIAFLLQPFIFNFYINKKFNIENVKETDGNLLSERWSGFGINISNVITTNTDTIVLTLFSSLSQVSIYAIYNSVITAIKGLILSVCTGFSAYLGQLYFNGDLRILKEEFNRFETMIYSITAIVFNCTIVLLVPFVEIYTSGVSDANYSQPLFAVLISLSVYVICIREPYILLTYNAGMFRQTKWYAYIESGINIIISIMLVTNYGLIGVAIGTLISSFLRMVLTMLFLKNNIIYRSPIVALKKILIFTIPIFLTLILSMLIEIQTTSIFLWIIHAVIILIYSIVIYFLINLIFFRKDWVFITKKRS